MKPSSAYTLQKYAGRSTRHTCPQCGRPHCFTRYVDPDGNMLDETVGRCDHESSCGYHRTPKQYFDEHPSLKQDWRTPASGRNYSSARRHTSGSIQHSRQQPKPPCTIPGTMLEKSVRPDIPSTFVTFLKTIFPEETVISLITRYHLGVTRSRDVIYFQVEMKHAGQLPEDWQLTQCLFGEHLLSAVGEKQKTVALVESEKTAVIASGIMPKYIWLATGGKSQLSPEKLSVLRGRKVIAFPDVDGYRQWKEKLSAIGDMTITVSDVLEKNATDKERLAHIDIADWLIRWRQDCIRRLGGTDTVPFPDHNPGTWNNSGTRDNPGPSPEHCPQFANPNMQLVAKYFPAQHWSALEELIDEFDLIPTTLRITDPI